MLTAEDKEDIRRIVAETVLGTLADSVREEPRADPIQQQAKPIVEIAARAMEIFGTREKALRWLNTPVPSLGDQTPLSSLGTPEGIREVERTLGQVEHGIW